MMSASACRSGNSSNGMLLRLLLGGSLVLCLLGVTRGQLCVQVSSSPPLPLTPNEEEISRCAVATQRGPCNVSSATISFNRFTAGDVFTASIWKMEDYYNERYPGSIELILLPQNGDKITVAQIPDSQSDDKNWQRQLSIPIPASTSPGHYSLQAAYYSNHPEAPRELYHCVDLDIIDSELAGNTVAVPASSVVSGSIENESENDDNDDDDDTDADIGDTTGSVMVIDEAVTQQQLAPISITATNNDSFQTISQAAATAGSSNRSIIIVSEESIEVRIRDNAEEDDEDEADGSYEQTTTDGDDERHEFSPLRSSAESSRPFAVPVTILSEHTENEQSSDDESAGAEQAQQEDEKDEDDKDEKEAIQESIDVFASAAARESSSGVDSDKDSELAKAFLLESTQQAPSRPRTQIVLISEESSSSLLEAAFPLEESSRFRRPPERESAASEDDEQEGETVFSR